MTAARRSRYRRRRPKSPIIAVIVLFLVFLRYYSGESLLPPQPLSEGIHRVDRVVDGDTLLLANDARVRLIGADTPETVKPNHPVEPWGPEAVAFTQRFVANGDVRLTFDREKLDRYERYLAYVWVDQKMLNEELIRAGLAKAKTEFNYAAAMKRRFRLAEDEARAASRGIWSASLVNSN